MAKRVQDIKKGGVVWLSMRRNSKIQKEQTEIVKSEDRQDYGRQNLTNVKHRTHDTTLITKARVTRTLQKQGWVQVLRKVEQLLHH